ncbi:MAG TPA: hypothetical protein VK661_02610 [Planctomycetota bacterium]|nr:hypothetical protein [Planctomycetota bacterium]
MPKGPGPAEERDSEERTPEVGGGEGIDAQEVLRTFEASAGEPVFHPDPVPIPSGAIPAPPEPERASSVGPTLVIGACGSLWFAAALSSGATVPALFAAFWLALLAVDLWFGLRR